MRRAGFCLFFALTLVVPAMLPATSQIYAQSTWIGVPPPEACVGDPMTAEEIVGALTEGNRQPTDPDAIPLIGIEENELPTGTEPDSAELDSAIAAVWATTACANAGDFARLFVQMTPAAIYGLISGLFDAIGRPPAPFSAEELANLETNITSGLNQDPEALIGDARGRIDAIRGARLLPDGRLLLLVDGKIILDGTGYILLIEVDGVWKIDRMGQIGDIDMLGINSGGVAGPTPIGGEPVIETPTAVNDSVTSTPEATTNRDLPASISLDAIRTLVYTEITAWETAPNVRAEESPVISDDGEHIAFTRSPGTGSAEDPNRVFVMDVDGSNEREIDSYIPLCYCGSLIDISADGSTVVSSDAVQLRVADSAGSGGRLLLTLSNNEINALRISGDGRTIAFRIYRDVALKDSADILAMGIYVINVDGTDLRLLAGADDIAATFGVSAEQVPASGPPNSFDVSHDGSRVVAAVFIDPQPGGYNQALIGLGSDGSILNLHDPEAFITNVAISGDGNTTAYVFVEAETNVTVAAVVPTGGGDVRRLTDSSNVSPGIGQSLTNSGERIQLTEDGSLLLLGGTGLLVDTDNGRLVALAVTNGSAMSADPPQLVGERLEYATMDASASRFLYMTPNLAGVLQLVTVDLNPGTTGDAPVVVEMTLDQETIGLNENPAAVATVKIETGSDFVRVGATVLRAGRSDPNVARGGASMTDDGTTAGDSVANDGIYTTNRIAADCCAVTGPRLMRIKVETIGTDGRRHATAIDGLPFEVTE